MRITIEALVRADPATVWSAWTTPADIVQWNAASDDWHTTQATVDLREGGAFSSRMEARDGSAGFDFAGTYTEVVPERRLAFRMADARTVTVDFDAEPGGTRLRETFDADAGAHTIEQQRQGWQAILDRFARHAEQKADAPLHRRFAGRCNNRAWDLVDRTDRTPAEDRELLDAAHASSWHWTQVGSELQRRRADMLVCQAHAALGLGGRAALERATAMRDWFLAAAATPDWERAFAHVVHAGAALVAGDTAAHRDSWTQAASAIEAIADAEDRSIVEKTFATVPRP